MISPSYSMTATERVLPRLALDFTTATLDPRVTFTRTGNTATVTNSSGVIVGINADLPRFDHNPATLICNGLLIEESRTNVLLNSLLDGTSLATQSVTVTAAARTLSFYGTGEIVLSGAHSATVTGTGAYPTRTTLTFTPSAGTLTLTVTGSVQFAQLELGSFATSFIPTEASQVTRNADVATMTGTNFSDWFNASEGAFNIQALGYTTNANQDMMVVWNGTVANRMLFWFGGTPTTAARFTMITAGATVMDGNLAATGTARRLCVSYKENNTYATANASGTNLDTTCAIPTVDQLRIGGSVFSGWVKTLNYWPQRLTNNETYSFSKVV